MKQQLNIGNLAPKKSLGQNFIIDKNFLLKMNNHIATTSSDVIIEIGPGKGALTEYLSKKNFKKLFLIEKDNNLATQLKLKYKKIKNIFIINDDDYTLNNIVCMETLRTKYLYLRGSSRYNIWNSYFFCF